jgi:hypothetical protein
LLAVDGIVGGIQVEDDLRGGLGPGADEQIDQEVVTDAQALDLGAALLEQGGALFARQLGIAARVAVQEAVERRGRGQGPVGVGGQALEELEEGIVAGVVGVVAIGIASEELVDELNEQRLQGVVDVQGRTGIGQTARQVRDDTKGHVELTDDEQAGVFDQAASGKVNDERL